MVVIWRTKKLINGDSVPILYHRLTCAVVQLLLAWKNRSQNFLHLKECHSSGDFPQILLNVQFLPLYQSTKGKNCH